MSKFRFIDLFAGLGGFHVALERLGGECVLAAEIRPHLQTIYSSNFGVTVVGDIREVVPAEVPEHEVLCAGFPCQAFSKAGDQAGFNCSHQGTLFFDVVAILKEKRPRHFILENVPNLLKHDGGNTFQRIKTELEELGYVVDEAKLSPHHFGIPQVRERLYIVGRQESLMGFKWPERETHPISITNVLENYPADAKALSQKTLHCLTVWNRFLELCPMEVALPSFPIWSMQFDSGDSICNSRPLRVSAARSTANPGQRSTSVGTGLAAASGSQNRSDRRQSDPSVRARLQAARLAGGAKP